MQPATVNSEHAYLTLREVIEHYRTNERTVRYWRKTGFGPKGRKVGTRVLYPRAEVEKFDRELARDSSHDGSAVTRA
jgi:hypothetical protein